MKSNEVGTTPKHPETINGNVKNLSKSDILLYLSFSSLSLSLSFMKMKDKGECHFYFKNFTLPLITRVGEMEGVGTSLNSINKAKKPSAAHQNTLQLHLA
jgi:hypothetical protein